MIEHLIIAYLNSDIALDALLNVTGTDTKIYPAQMPHGTDTPFITYEVSSDGTTEENLREITMGFNIAADTYSTVNSIRNKLSDMLDRQDEIQGLIPDATYFIYWGKKVGGGDSKDSDLDQFNKRLTFNFKYMPKVLP